MEQIQSRIRLKNEAGGVLHTLNKAVSFNFSVSCGHHL